MSIIIPYEKLVITRFRKPDLRKKLIELSLIGEFHSSIEGLIKIYHSKILKGYYKARPIIPSFPERGYSYCFISKKYIEHFKEYKKIIEDFKKEQRKKQVLSICTDLVKKDITSIILQYDII